MLKAIDFAARLRSGSFPARASRLVTGALAIGLAAAAVQEGLDLRWALGAFALATATGYGRSVIRSNEFPARSPGLQTLVNAHLFGLTPASGRAPAGATARRDTTLVLTGTLATPDPSSGFALIGSSAQGAQVHPVGDSLAGGAVLSAVYPDHVIVERGGQRSAVFFPRGGRAALVATAIRSPVSAARGVRSNPDDVDSEQLERQHIEETIEAESERTAAFVRQEPFYSDDQLRGIALEPGSDPAMLAQLGLKAGDVLEFINGSPIAEADRLDWLRQRLQSGEPVELSVIRPGAGEVDVKIPGGAVDGMIEN